MSDTAELEIIPWAEPSDEYKRGVQAACDYAMAAFNKQWNVDGCPDRSQWELAISMVVAIEYTLTGIK